MRALTFQGKRRLRCESVPEPQLLDRGDAIVKVLRAGICGSDMHVYHARETGLDLGTVMGHEFVGEVIEVGPDVSGFAVGDLVLSPFTTSCGSCFYCRMGLTSRCESGQLYGWVEQGLGLHGAQAEYVRVPLAQTTLMPLPEGVSLEEALLLCDVLPTGFFCAAQARIEADGVDVVVGCGPVGLMGIVGALELGAKTIFAIDSVPERLLLAEKLGARVIDFSTQDPRQVVREATQGRGADAVLEFVGSRAAGRTAFDLVRPGGVISVVGVHTDTNFSFSPAEAYDKNLTYHVGRCPARHLAPTLVPLVQSKRYDLSAVITHRLPLTEGVAGYDLFDQKRDGCIKVVLVPGSP